MELTNFPRLLPHELPGLGREASITSCRLAGVAVTGVAQTPVQRIPGATHSGPGGAEAAPQSRLTH